MRKLVGVMVVAAGATGIVVAGAPGRSLGTRTVVLTEVPQGRLIGVVDNPPRAA